MRAHSDHFQDEDEAPILAPRIKRRPNYWASVILCILGLPLLIFVWPLGLILLLVAGLLDRAHWICGECGNRIEPTSSLCPTCRSHLE